MMKYIKLRSVTWWASMAPLTAGLFIAFEPVHGLTGYVDAMNSVFDGMSPAVLINSGLFGIGLRGAIK